MGFIRWAVNKGRLLYASYFGLIYLSVGRMLSRQCVNHICFSAQSHSIKYLFDGKKSEIHPTFWTIKKSIERMPFFLFYLIFSDIWGCILWWVLLINFTWPSPGRTVRTEAHPGQHSNVHTNTKYLPGGHQNNVLFVLWGLGFCTERVKFSRYKKGTIFTTLLTSFNNPHILCTPRRRICSAPIF